MKEAQDNIIVVKTRAFAIASIALYKHIAAQNEYVLSRQFLKSSTSIGANVKEAVRAQSKADFVAKMSIALKEASETEYWLDLLHESNYIKDNQYEQSQNDCVEIIKILTTIINKAGLLSAT